MTRIPDRRLRAMMEFIGFDTLEELEEWLNQPADPQLLERIGPAYLEEEPDPADDEDSSIESADG